MKQFIISTIAFLAFSISLYSQSGTSEIDRLYGKYKDTPTIELITVYGNLDGVVTIEKNQDNLPQSITISITTSNVEAAAKFVSEFIQQKLDAGYKTPNGFWTDGWSFEGMQRALKFGREENYIFEKGNLYTKVRHSASSEYLHNSYSSQTLEITNCYIVIETGDRSRFGGSNATKFDF